MFGNILAMGYFCDIFGPNHGVLCHLVKYLKAHVFLYEIQLQRMITVSVYIPILMCKTFHSISFVVIQPNSLEWFNYFRTTFAIGTMGFSHDNTKSTAKNECTLIW